MKPKTKRKLFSIAVITICLSIAGTGTLAYFTDSTTAHNVITTGGVDIEIVETRIGANGETEPFVNNITGVMPGESVSKIVCIENCDEPAWIRVMVNISGQFADGTAMWGSQLWPINLDFDQTSWTYCEEDNYWYYKEIVGTDKTTAPLFQNVKFDEAMPNEYQDCTVYIDVKAQAVQAANNKDGIWPSEDEIIPYDAN